MRDAQLRLLPASQPLVERLGTAWFRALPTGPGVYRMHDAEGRLVYVGKAANLRRRLSSYRRTHGHPPRIVRLIHAADRIDWEPCASESDALRREAELIRTLLPRFNRAGKWTPAPLHVGLEWNGGSVRIPCAEAASEGAYGPFRAEVRRAVASLVRLLWLASHPDAAVTELPHALGSGPVGESVVVLPPGTGWRGWLSGYFGNGELEAAWELAERLEGRGGAFMERFVRAEWETVSAFARRHPARRTPAG